MTAATAQLNNFITGDTSTANAPRKGLFMRAIAAVQRAQALRAEREIAIYIAHRGGRLTDTIERQINNQFV